MLTTALLLLLVAQIGFGISTACTSPAPSPPLPSPPSPPFESRISHISTSQRPNVRIIAQIPPLGTPQAP
ncbi:hypothetical protein CCMSSC00406_0007078 [Pleurotus cornucopiae]|uniref:Uncharacterized protein n=1 Tax=Pleurotus cornucopiae TaxID=5321 RepID=A0ACB7J3T2_PLECO|nr:hypothetical protein CCMSSC00406_0007078 [Pleurotus cornucopiae]